MKGELRKIVFTISSLGSGGAERVVSTLSNEFVQRGYQVDVIMIVNNHQNYPLSDKIRLIKLSCGERYQNMGALKRTWFRIRDVRKAIKESHADVVVSFMSETNIDVCFASLGLKVPVIVSERNDPASDPASRAKQILRKIAYGRANGFVFQTPDAQAYFSSKIQKKSCIILNPLTSLLPKPYEGERDKRIVAVGRLNQQKNYPLLIEAFSEFIKIQPDHTLEIYGEGLLEDALRKELEGKGLQDSVLLKGFCSNVHEQILSAGFFVMTSNMEGMPNALVEAMALGLPCISTDCPCGGPRLLIQNGQNGLLVPVRKKEPLLQAMLKMAEDPVGAADMGKNAREIIRKVRLDTIVDQWLSYMRDIC